MLQARFFFQQLISGVSYCHGMVCELSFLFVIFVLKDTTICLSWISFSASLMKQVCHRDLKLENTLLDGSPAPRLKICDFGYSKVLIFFSCFYLYLVQHWRLFIIGNCLLCLKLNVLPEICHRLVTLMFICLLIGISSGITLLVSIKSLKYICLFFYNVLFGT